MSTFYTITKYLTFPGAFLRAFWEHFMCKILKIPVEDSAYLRAGEMCGHIDHAFASKAFPAYTVAIMPGLLNFFCGMPIMLTGVLNLRVMGITPSDSVVLFILYIVMAYVGISMLCNIFPDVETVMNLWDIIFTSKKSNIFARILTVIPSALMYAGAYLEKFGITVILWIAASVLLFVF